jgi:DNA-binding MarR family transcriptional regulator
MTAKKSASSAEARDLVVVLSDLAWLLPRTIAAEASRPEPLPQSELEIMRLLTRRPGLSVNTVASDLQLQATNVSTLVRSLVGRGLLERRPDEKDGRVVHLVPTGRALAERDDREHSWGVAVVGILGELEPGDADNLLSAVPALRRLSERLGRRDR